MINALPAPDDEKLGTCSGISTGQFNETDGGGGKRVRNQLRLIYFKHAEVVLVREVVISLRDELSMMT